MSRGTPLVLLHVFEDPGIDFFQLRENELIVLERGNDTPEVLYLNCHGRVYDLVEHGADPLTVIVNHRGGREIDQHGLLTIQCIHILKETTGRSRACVQYATKYWARHLALSNMEGKIWEELRRIGLPDTRNGRQSGIASLFVKPVIS